MINIATIKRNDILDNLIEGLMGIPEDKEEHKEEKNKTDNKKTKEEEEKTKKENKDEKKKNNGYRLHKL